MIQSVYLFITDFFAVIAFWKRFNYSHDNTSLLSFQSIEEKILSLLTKFSIINYIT